MRDKYERSVLDAIATLVADASGTADPMPDGERRLLQDWLERRLYLGWHERSGIESAALLAEFERHLWYAADAALTASLERWPR